MGTKVEGIWIGEKDLTADEAFIASAQEEMNPPSIVDTIADSDGVEDVAANRRDFLKIMGFSISAATVASCNIPVKRAMPYVVKPDAIVPGVATYYASSFVDGGDYCPILVKTRDGRPIKVEGNVLSDITKGGTSARTQGMVLGLYDVNRLKRPTIDDEQVEWSALDAQAKQIFQNSKGIRIVTRTILSPTAKKAVGEFVAKYPQTQITTYDPVSSAAILTANETDFGDRVIPDYHFDKAEIIVGFDADFLGTWISPIEYSNRYIKGRKIKDIKHAKMSKHVQVEAQMSLTGSNADNRILVRPSEQPAAVAYLYQVLTGGAGNTPLNEKAQNAIDALARQLLSAKGKSLVVSGSNDANVQTLVNAINSELGNYGKTITFDHASLQRQGDERELVKLVADINAGAVDTVVFHGGDPLFEYASLPGLAEAISSVTNCISLGYFANRTNAASSIVAPVHHNLECWGDAEPKRGMISLMQPTIAPLFDTRQAEHSLLVWAESPTLDTEAEQPYFEYLKTTWEEERFDSNSGFLSFQRFFDKTLQDGVYKYSVDKPESAFSGNVGQALGRISAPSESDLEIQFTESIAVGNGQFADNPWLQEMPDPVTRCAWGNYLAVPVDFDGVKRFKALNGLEDGDLADLTINGTTYRVPVIQQFGQMPGTVALHMGYGRDMGSMAAQGIGVNVNDAMTMSGDRLHYFATDVSLSRSKGKEKEFSCVQYFDTMGVTAPEKTGDIINADEATLAPGYGNIAKGYQGSLTKRSIIRHAHVDELEQKVDDLIHEREHHEGLNQETLYPYSRYVEEKYSQGHHWGMHVDLNSCTGCGACTVACMAENNIPVVGKKQISRHQEMAWLRIDRYYYGDIESPNVVYQPMMCQHCDNAPCENVCPVNATNHSSEGLNQMTYNRCIGTRYCANNCPYKVRRFNWLDYTTADIFPANQVKVNGEEVPFGADNLTRMVLNPDVTVRSRGVIEKCSFCVQRIQQGKLAAKTEGRRLVDADVRTACQTACPTGAITFGDQNDKDGELHKAFTSPLNMIVLEETNTRSSVQYTMKVNNRDVSLEA